MASSEKVFDLRRLWESYVRAPQESRTVSLYTGDLAYNIEQHTEKQMLHPDVRSEVAGA